jgi:hypothetical protein
LGVKSQADSHSRDGIFLMVKKELDAAGIMPALDPEKVGTTFYQRKDLTA